MTIHLVKLCVGADSVDDLRDWQNRLLKRLPAPVHHTRMFPKQVDALLEGGSIYWVVKGVIQVRQPIVDVREVRGETGRMCELVFDPKLTETEPQPKRPFQGWRYLKPADAPADLSTSDAAAPPALAAELKAALVW